MHKIIFNKLYRVLNIMIISISQYITVSFINKHIDKKLML